MVDTTIQWPTHPATCKLHSTITIYYKILLFRKFLLKNSIQQAMVFGKPVVSMLNPSKVTLLIFKIKLVIIVVEQGIDILCKISVFTFDKVNAFCRCQLLYSMWCSNHTITSIRYSGFYGFKAFKW